MEAIEMELFRILHHVPGRIRIEIPCLKRLSAFRIVRLTKRLCALPVPSSIRDVRPNPNNGNVVITYEPGKIDIERYIGEMLSDPGVLDITAQARLRSELFQGLSA